MAAAARVMAAMVRADRMAGAFLWAAGLLEAPAWWSGTGADDWLVGASRGGQAAAERIGWWLLVDAGGAWLVAAVRVEVTLSRWVR